MAVIYQKHLLTLSLLVSVLVHGSCDGNIANGDIEATWFTGAHASFYGDMKGRGTMKGSCGYGNLKKQGYGLETTALSIALFNDGLSCGACFAIICVDDPVGCIRNSGAVLVTATNYCPPNYTKPPEGYNNWCNPPLKHFQLSKPMFTQIANETVRVVVPVIYRRVPCAKNGGVQFQLVEGNGGTLQVLVYNVAGAGDVYSVKIKGSKTTWLEMSRYWGQIWEVGTNLQGQSLSFQVMTSDQKMRRFDEVVPGDWTFGKTFDGKKNFYV